MRFAGTAAIVTTRYDRFTASDAHFYRLHQEDLRQSTSTLPHCKYEVTARDVVSVLRKTGAAGEQIDLFAQGVLLSWILAAPDAPAKNYSVVLAGNKPVLVPLYDVATGLGQAIKYDRLAMAIGGENRMSAVKSEHVLRFAEAPALDDDALQDFAALSAPLIPLACSTAVDELTPYLDAQELEEISLIANVLRSHCEGTLRSLA